MLKTEERAIFALRGLYRRHGYLPYKMSRFEEYDLYVRNKDFLVSDQFITFADPAGKLLALKPDVTLSIIKNVKDQPGVVQKLYYNENVYRAEKPGAPIKEIMQTGLECVGDIGSFEIAEVVLLAAKSLALLGSPFLLDISHMGLIGAVLDSCGLSGEARGEALRCLRQKNSHELESLCDGLAEEKKKKLFALVEVSGDPRTALPALDELLTENAERSALLELQRLCGILARSGYGDALRVDFSVGNDMKYYNGVVFKGYLEGIPASVLSGGQYDRLLKKMGKSSRAIGFALYLSLLERQGLGEDSFSVDTLILHDGTAEPEQLMALAEEAAKDGSVLVSAARPQGRSWRKLISVEKGEAKCLEENG